VSICEYKSRVKSQVTKAQSLQMSQNSRKNSFQSVKQLEMFLLPLNGLPVHQR